MEVVRPSDPDGQHFLLREYLQTVLAAAPFHGEAWTACTTAFLAYRALPLVGSNFTTLAPASFFLGLYERSEPDFGTDREGRWGEAEFRRTMGELGDQKLQQLVATDGTRSWAIYLTEDLKAVLAFHGRVKPGPRFDPKQDEQDVREGEVVRELLPAGLSTVDKLDLSTVKTVTVHVTGAAGEQYELIFSGCQRIQHPPPGDSTVRKVDEVRGQSGRTWFVFRRVGSDRPMAIQAEAAEIHRL